MEQSETSHPTRVAVIGAGISGLAAAHRLTEAGATHVDVFEAGHHAGGLLRTEEISGFLIERGADALITNKPAGVDLCRRLGLEAELLPVCAENQRSLVLFRGQPVPVPAGFQLLTPASIESLQTSPLFSDADRRRIEAERQVPAGTDPDESVAAFVRRRFGDAMFERLAQPMVGGIYTADPEKLSLASTLPRFQEMERTYGSLLAAMADRPQEAASGARYGLFTALRGGCGQLIRRLVERLSDRHVSVQLNQPVQSVQRTENGWRIVAGDRRTDYDAMIITTSAIAAGRLLDESGPPIASAVREIEYSSSAVVCTGHALQDFRHPLNAFGLVVPAVEQRRVLAVSFASRKFPHRAPPGMVLLRTFLGGALQPNVLDGSDDDLLTIVLDELRSIFGLQAPPVLSLVTRYPSAIPQYHIGHRDRVDRIRNMAAALPGLELAGNAWDGVGIPDTIRSAEAAAERVLTQLDLQQSNTRRDR